MKTRQEINNIRGSVSACRNKVILLTTQLEQARRQLYDDTIRLFQYETGINIGDTVSWNWKVNNDIYGFEALTQAPFPDPIGEVVAISYTDYTGIQITVKRGNLQAILSKKDLCLPIIEQE